MTFSGDFTILVPAEDIGKRLDTLLCDHLETCSRSTATNLIRSEKVLVDGVIKKSAYRVRPGETITGTIPAPLPIEQAPEPVDFGVIYEDADLLVVNKPAGLVVHPAPGHNGGTLVNGLLFHCPDLAQMGGIGGKIRPGIVHRLDKDTSGILLVAKHDAAHIHLSRQFKERKVEKRYLALVYGEPERESGKIELPLGRHPVDRKKMSVASPRARQAFTEWVVERRFPGAALLGVRIHTGRTHQIRVHLTAVGHAIVGDKVYGKVPKGAGVELKKAQRQMLHAHEIRFFHPADDCPRKFVAPIPGDMARLLEMLAGGDQKAR